MIFSRFRDSLPDLKKSASGALRLKIDEFRLQSHNEIAVSERATKTGKSWLDMDGPEY